MPPSHKAKKMITIQFEDDKTSDEADKAFDEYLRLQLEYDRLRGEADKAWKKYVRLRDKADKA